MLVLASWLVGQPMNLVFSSPLDLFAIAGAAFIVRSVAADGETTWFEGLLLVGVYLLFALAYYFASWAERPGPTAKRACAFDRRRRREWLDELAKPKENGAYSFPLPTFSPEQ